MVTAVSDLTSVRTAAFDEIPIIDFADLLRRQPGAKAAAAKAIRHACETVGFFYIRNHGVPQADVEQTFEVGRRFFALALEHKLSIHKKLSPQHAGYTPLLAENTDLTNDGDLHESFDMVSPLALYPGKKSTGEDMNLWPQSLPELKGSLDRYFHQMLDLGKRLFEMVASSVQGRDVATVASGVLALAGVALLGIVRDLASAAAVRRRQGFYDATVTALEALRANGSRVLAAWGVRGVAAIAAATLVFFAAPSGADGHRLAAPAAFLLHQFALGLVAALHVSWLRVALRRVEPSAHGP